MKQVRQNGFVLVIVLSLTMLVLLLVSVTTITSVNTLQAVGAEARKIPAFYVANAGLERSMARMTFLLTSTPPAVTATTSEAGAIALAAALNSTGSGTLEGGSFVVTATAVGPKVVLASEGTSLGGGKRRVTLEVSVVLPPPLGNVKLMAPAAITTTGSAVDSGNAPIQGVAGAPVDAQKFTIACAVGLLGNCVGTGAPVTYSTTVTGTPPVEGQNVTYNVASTDPKSSITYQVTKVTTTTSPFTGLKTTTADLTAVSENALTTVQGNGKQVTQIFTPTSLTNGAILAPTTEVPSLLTYGTSSTNGSNTGDTCVTYNCNKMDIPPDQLFQTIFGVTKTTFEASLPAINKVTTDSCPNPTGSNTVQWLTLGASASANLADCPAPLAPLKPRPRVLIVDGSKLPPGSSVSIQNNNSSFFGLLYVINNKGGISMTGNGTIAGALVAETGTEANNADFKLAGTAKIGVCNNTGNHDAKICYDKPLLDSLLLDLKAQVIIPSTPVITRNANTWKEVSGN
ncbi:hypothetical protein E7T06_01455 [Deinococcus sp. Arct2-2]|uniref:hypothetical protein n=1 Tax=Deinococcus sp. Arct2-2 TaxID=2568653 RepID=UPI0010A51389|nr:hypothetical protein [Deinococcus sp. Arct2-2]THF71650.1 hypothetical protein E7T06_01455 [Deinococcus sp. Arct2-2]